VNKLVSIILAASFTQALPAELPVTSGLQLHFDAANVDSQGNATLLDGQTVSEWKDLSGNGFHLDSATGTPTYIQPGPGFGGLPVVGFDPLDFNGADFLNASGTPITQYPFTVFAVVRSDTDRNAVIFSMVDSDAFDKMTGIRYVSEGQGGPGRLSHFRRNTNWIEATSDEPFHNNEFHIVTARFYSPTLARLYVDGELSATSEVRVDLPAFDRFDLGNTGRSNATTDPYEGQIAEVLVYNEDVTNGDRTATESYLSQKWITGTAGIIASDESVDFGSVALGETQTRRVTLSYAGASSGTISVNRISLDTLGDFTLRTFLNDVEFDPADSGNFPLSLAEATGDQLELQIGINASETKLAYQGAVVVSSDAENQPELPISFSARLRDRLGVTDYLNHRREGNLVEFDLEGGSKVRVTMNTDAMARVQFAPEGVFRSDFLPDYFMVQKYDWEPVTYSIQDRGDYIGIHTPTMTIRAQKSPFRLQMYDASNTVLICKDKDEEGMYAELGQRGVSREENGSGHARFGFGAGDHGHSRPLNKNGGYDQFTVTHGRTCVPFFMSTAGYGVFLNTVEKATSFDSQGGFQTADHLDYWYMAGDFKEVLGLYSELTGNMKLFPKWAYGFMLSKYGNDHATQGEFSEWINRLRDEDYPTDSYVFDFGWRGGKFAPHRWDPERFPDLPGMFAESKELGFHIGLHNNKGTPEAGNGDFTNPSVAENWWQAHWPNVIEPGYGDWFWPDEFDVAGDNLMANRSAKVVHERWLEATPDQRPMFITRGGFANHHFAATWSGDIPNTIEEMSEQITGSLALGLSGYPWSSNDLGGFFTKPSDELYIRWVAQFGAFSSIMRAHGHDGREPWLYSEQAQENLRRYLKIRYQLFPYIYSTARQGSESGIPMMRAMALEHSDNPEAWTQDKQYYFGDWLLVAPALSTGTTDVSIWLPEGTWCDYFDSTKRITGGQTIQVTATLDQIPVFVREGAIIPTGPEISYADEKPLDPLTLELFPGPTPTTYSLYEDDGVTRAYQLNSAFALTRFTADWPQENTLRFTKGAIEQGNSEVYSPSLPRSTILRAHRWTEKPRMVLIGSTLIPETPSLSALENLEAGWFWSEEKEQLVIRFTDDGAEHRIVASTTVLDSDGDGLDDLREAEIGTDVYQSDSDGDGQSDLLEVSFGISPLDSRNRVTVSGSIPSDDPSSFEITWPSLPGSLYCIEKWQETTGGWQTIAELLATTHVSRFLWPMAESRVLLRVRATAG
jgi:alpha-glucosidase (family GH31 glycosyl hydrolase)